MLGILLLCSLAIGGIYVFAKPIKNKVAQSISGQLATPVNISDIQLSVFKNFPNISVSFTNIRAAESTKITGQPLMVLQSFTLSLNPINLIRGRYLFEDIRLSDGKLIAAKTEKTNNYSILKPDTSKSQSTQVKLSFKKITLRNIQVQYIDAVVGDTIDLLVNNTELSGHFNEKEFLVKTAGSVVPLALRLGGQKIALTKPVNFQTSFTVNRPDTSVSFEQTKLQIENFNFIVNGKIISRKVGTQCKLQLLGDNLNLQQLLSLIPKKYLSDIEGFESNGMLECKVDINGEWTKTDVPAVQASFKIVDGLLGKKGIDVQLRNIALAGKLSYEKRGGLAISSLEINRISTVVNGEKVSGTLSLADFSNPYIKASLQGNLNLAQWSKLLTLKSVDTLEGIATVNLNVEGKIADFKKKTKELPALFEGNVEARNLKLALSGSPYVYSNISGKVYASNNLLKIDTLHGDINGNTLGLKGYARHLLDYLFSTGKQLQVEGSFYSPHIDIPSLTATNTPKNKTGDDTVGIVMPHNTSFKLKTKVDRLTFNKFSARNVIGTVAMGGGVLTLNNLDFEAMNGTFALTGNMFDKGDGQFVISAQMDVKKADMNQLFDQCANFGQKQITSDNLQGTLNAHLQLAAPMDKYLSINTEKMFVQAQLAISGGRLYNYKPLLKLSSFINVDELQDINFELLENTIEIKDQKVIIPQMEIKNSALNLTAEGYHGFDNYMEYKFRVKLNDVLGKKFNRKKAKTENYEENKDGINIFILMKGTPDDLKIQYDRKSAIKKLQKNIKEEKNTLLDLLRDEFNIKKKDKKGNAQKPKETEDESIPEWETDIPE